MPEVGALMQEELGINVIAKNIITQKKAEKEEIQRTDGIILHRIKNLTQNRQRHNLKT